MAEPPIDLEKLVRDVLAEFGIGPQPDRSAPQAGAAARPAARHADESLHAGQGLHGGQSLFQELSSPACARGVGGEGTCNDAEISHALTPRPSPVERKRESSRTDSTSNGALVVANRVVTLSDLEGRLAGVKRLVVPPQAVVTPSVRDELHKRGVEIVYGRSPAVPPASGVRLAIVVHGSRFDPTVLIRALQSEPIATEIHRTDCLVAATDLLAREVLKPNTLGLVVSTYAAAAVCLANRHRGVRAILGIDAATIAADAASVGANVLAINPRTTGLFPMKQMVTRFAAEGVRECPEALRQRLG